MPSAPAVIIDDFNGNHLGTRSVTLSNNGGTTPMPSFSEANGVATMRLSGSGNSQTSVQLDYALPSVDSRVGRARAAVVRIRSH
jgi:hypothetical protein